MILGALRKWARNLQELRLVSNKIDAKGIEVLAEALLKGPLNNTKQLDLQNIKIGMKGVKVFFEALTKGAPVNHHQKREMTDGGTALEGASTNLTKLSLANNMIGDEEMQ
eukprot:scaffold148366_cov31-Tisochrysis_lutea.AAC.1